ncbi:prephenate dehydrogenase [Pseudonocardia eucalypti]|uniref:Prephenate dehydrogenase n=1 Tax=Pseudonocardia eucalypti TaxID=648755 RepID=A0ABP9PDR0_9PSEU
MIGLGLIGGSLVRAATAAGRVTWGATASVETADAARADGYDVARDTDEALLRARDEDALVVLATPLTAVATVLRRVDAMAPECRLTDVVSVQAPVTEAVLRLAPRTRYVGGHPMAGTAESGWPAGSAKLFDRANWVVIAEDDTDPEVWADVAELAWACGSLVVPSGVREHDAAVGRISHLTHLFAAILASVAAAGNDPWSGAGGDDGALALTLAAGSFADATRVMDTRPELVLAMCEGNRAGLLPAVDDALGRLGAARGSLASTGGLAATVNAGHQARMEWHELRSAPARRTIPRAPLDLAELRKLGHAGTQLTGWSA